MDETWVNSSSPCVRWSRSFLNRPFLNRLFLNRPFLNRPFLSI